MITTGPRAGPPVLLDLAMGDERISGNMRVVGFTSSNRRIRSCAANDSHNVDLSRRLKFLGSGHAPVMLKLMKYVPVDLAPCNAVC